MEIELRGWLDKRVKKKKNYFSISLGSSKTLSNFASAFRTRGRKKRETRNRRPEGLETSWKEAESTQVI